MTEAKTGNPAILVVDDSRLMRVAARKILKNDFDILEAEDGEVAWEALQNNRQITLVMSDLSMPNLDGLGLLKKIRESSDAHLKALPVIIVTGAEDDDGSKKVALSAGASDFITKPFESVQLLARAQAQTKQQRTQQALQHSENSKQQLEEQSSVDALTGLTNQRAFNDHIEESLSYAVRHASELALLLIRLEKYKVLFLRRGKQTAEEVLRRLTPMLCEGRRREDTVARIGLDTFAILLPSASQVGAKRVSEQLLAAISQKKFDIGAEPVSLVVSIAVSSPEIHAGIKSGDLLADATEKLKIAQKAGGNCVQCTLAEVATDASTGATAKRAPLTVASPAEVQRALQALSTGKRIDTPTDELARAVLPLLEAWNQAHDGRYTSVTGQLTAALQPDSNRGAHTEPVSESTLQSV